MKTNFSIGDKVRIKRDVYANLDQSIQLSQSDSSLQEDLYKAMQESGIGHLTVTDIRPAAISHQALVYFKPRLLDQASVYQYRLELVPEERA